MNAQTVADIAGPWIDPQFDSGLIKRLKRNWTTPVGKLSNEALATFLRQRIALELIVSEAQKRVQSGFDDNSEMYDGELSDALNGLTGKV